MTTLVAWTRERELRRAARELLPEHARGEDEREHAAVRRVDELPWRALDEEREQVRSRGEEDERRGQRHADGTSQPLLERGEDDFLVHDATWPSRKRRSKRPSSERASTTGMPPWSKAASKRVAPASSETANTASRAAFNG